MSLNHVVIQGRLVKDPELKTLNTGTEVCNFRVAVDRRKEKGAETVADFIDCTAWGKTAAFVAEYFHRGDGVIVTGRLESRQWQDKDGNNRSAIGITVGTLDFPLGRKTGSGNAAPAYKEETEPDGKLPF